MKEGDVIRVNCPGDPYHGYRGVIVRISANQLWPYEVAIRKHVTQQPFKWVFNQDELEAL